MKWEVIEVVSSNSRNVVVLVRPPYILKGNWASSVTPSIHQRTYVELNVNLPLESMDIQELHASEAGSEVIDGINYMIGIVESVDEEDLVNYFRISEDCIIMLESSGIRLREKNYYRVGVPIDALEIYAS